MLIQRKKIAVPGAGERTEHVKSVVKHGQDTHIGSIRGSAVKVVKASGQGHFNKSGKFPAGGNQPPEKNRKSFDIKPTGNAAAVPLGPQDSKTQLAEKQKGKTPAQRLYPKMRSIVQTEANG
jgi:hypothetical protein